MKTFYSDYTQHCMRFYARRERPEQFPTLADRQNWEACETAVNKFCEQDREIIFKIYGNPDTLADNIYGISVEMGEPQDRFWKLIGDVEKAVAQERGLI